MVSPVWSANDPRSVMTVERLQEFTAAIVAQFEGLRGERDAALAECSRLEARAVTAESGLSSLRAEVDAAKDPARLPFWGAPVWRDEFDGDLSKWGVRNETTLSYDKARIMARNVTVRDGQLAITAKRETVAGRDFTTGYLDSIGKHSQQYGRWEIRAKIPTIPGKSRGIWPAFWLRCDSTVGEIDIMEAWGDPFTGATNVGCSSLTAHESTNGGANRKGWTWEHEARKADGKTRPHSALDFHTWAVEYTPTELVGYFDGVKAITMTKAAYPWLWGPSFQSPLNMRLNLQVGSPYHGSPVAPDYADTATPAEFLVDYVRVWSMPA